MKFAVQSNIVNLCWKSVSGCRCSDRKDSFYNWRVWLLLRLSSLLAVLPLTGRHCTLYTAATLIQSVLSTPL